MIVRAESGRNLRDASRIPLRASAGNEEENRETCFVKNYEITEFQTLHLAGTGSSFIVRPRGGGWRRKMSQLGETDHERHLTNKTLENTRIAAHGSFPLARSR